MKLGNLAFACYLYSSMTGYDKSYDQLRDKTKPQLELHYPAHRQALLVWLRAWGCRQFVLEYHELASREIADWYNQFARELFPKETALLDLSDDRFQLIERAYAVLVDRPAGERKSRGGGLSTVPVGPTDTAKILFALRPNALVPWDEPMRAHFRLEGSGQDYGQYLRKVQGELQELWKDCGALGIPFQSLPARLGRPHSSLAKLVDEYFWVTITRKCPCPPADQLAEWTSWRRKAGGQAGG